MTGDPHAARIAPPESPTAAVNADLDVCSISPARTPV
jgi:hypothetical protein